MTLYIINEYWELRAAKQQMQRGIVVSAKARVQLMRFRGTKLRFDDSEQFLEQVLDI